MTIDPLGINSAPRLDRGYPAQGAQPNTSRPAAATPPAALATNATEAADPAVQAGIDPATGAPTDELKEAVGKLNASVHAQNIEFSIDEESKRTIVKVIDTETKEVVRQLPTKEALEIAKSLDKAFGVLIRQQA
ncbi:flagellar protein FlaG [Pseudoduganella sp. SL102]|uniref:flagellar protein FlaG n=1 Tax=Pseudoduganella sp. SL102 TaxID=2995154 RepID=UPI00248BC903|nr:flagellar protein FlaG [Pseudoduganella sp. SL102]WBS01757.1 flagellar protein FlaG [Pseudoduganella sp. SL102]